MPNTQLDRMLFLQGNRCFFCDKALARADASLEHLVPQSKDGPDKEHNIVACCRRLNHVFGSMALKAKIQAILAQRGKFVCPDDKPALATKSVPNVTVASANAPTAAALAERALQQLRSSPQACPRTKKALIRHLRAQSLKGIPGEKVDQVIARLESEGYLRIDPKTGRVTSDFSPRPD